jgi:hypothetical protein
MYDQTTVQPEPTSYPSAPAVYQPDHPLAPTPAPGNGRGLLAVGIGAAVVAVLVLLVGGLLYTRSSRTTPIVTEVGGAAPPTTTAPDPAIDPATSTDDGTATTTTPSTPAVPAGGKATGTPAGGQPAGGQPTGGAPSGPAPAITSFTTPENIDCHNGNFQMFTASWATTNATKVTISIDGPGVFQTFGPSGSTSLPFSCSSAHTFLLTAYGQNGKTATKSITLQPRNVQPPSPPSGNADDAPVASGKIPVPTH